MLRLRPSEITLTQADVEETRRRMACRQAAAPSATPSARTPRARPHPGQGPRLRRGPERSRDDAIIRLGNIPVLTPYQVAHASADLDTECPPSRADSLNSESETSISNAPAASSPAEQTASVPSNTAAEHVLPSPTRNMQLAFRPAPRDGRVDTRLTSRENTEDTSSSPPKHQPGHSGLGRTRTNTSEDASEGAAQPRLPVSTDGFAEETGNSDVSGRGRVRSVRQHSSHAPSPLHQTHAVGSPGHQEIEHGPIVQGGALPEAPSTMYLQGYFASPEQYTFREYPIRPYTEPRQRPERPLQMVRTMTSNSDPSQPAPVRRSDRSRQPSSAEDVFWTSPASEFSGGPERETYGPSDGTEQRRPSLEDRVRSGLHSGAEFIQGRYRGLFGRSRAHQAGQEILAPQQEDQLDPAMARHIHQENVNRHTSQRFSEASSSSSLPYSYYELPISRHSSSNQSQGEQGQLPQSQYDGAAPSQEVSQGAYFSVRPSQVGLRPQPSRVSSHSSPNLAAFGQHGMSPLPASPYTRAHGSQSTPSIGLIGPIDFVGGDQDAVTAVQRDLSSPLEAVEQRAASLLPQVSSVFQYQVGDFDGPEQRQHRPRTARRSERRGLPGVRIGQRSSENVPVGTSLYEGRPIRTIQGQGHRVSIGQIQNAPAVQGSSMRGGDIQTSPLPLRFSMPQTFNSPRDLSNRLQLQSPYQRSSTTRSPRDLDRNDNLHTSSPASPYQGHRQVSQGLAYGSLRYPRSMPSYAGPYPNEADFQGQNTRGAVAGPQPYHERQEPAHTASYRRPDRVSMSTILDPAGASHRRLAMNRAPTSRRRLTPQQQNQENSGDAEAELMREELRVAGMRYADDGQELDVMDETPPRVGRFERHMMG